MEDNYKNMINPINKNLVNLNTPEAKMHIRNYIQFLKQHDMNPKQTGGWGLKVAEDENNNTFSASNNNNEPNMGWS